MSDLPADDAIFPLSVRDVRAIAWDRLWYFVFPAVLLAAAFVSLAMFLPPTFRSTAHISVESQQIPEELIRSTITSNATERIEFIAQRVLTRSKVLETIDDLNLYADQDSSDTELVSKFRNNVTLDVVKSTGNQRRAQAISFTLSFDADKPGTAQLVANELVTLFLNENVKTRSERAAQTTEFIAEESERIREQITELEKQVAAFKQQNRESMPELLKMNLALMSRYESDYQQAALSLEEVVAERRSLEIERDQYRSRSSDSGIGAGESIFDLERRYTAVLVENTEQHPDAIYLRREIARAKAEMERELDEDNTGAELMADPAYARLTTQLEAAQNKEVYLRESMRKLKLDLEEQELRIAKSPDVEQRYVDLQRDLANLEAKYQELRNKQIEAQISQNLEEEQKGERFTLLEAAVVPIKPESPNRPLIALGGTAFALITGIGLMVLRELLAPGIRGQATYTKLLGAEPLLTIPRFEDHAPVGYARAYLWTGAMFLVAGCIAGAIAFYTKADLLTVMGRFAS